LSLERWELSSYVVTVVGLPLAIGAYLYEQRKERANEEMVIFGMLISLFERAYLLLYEPGLADAKLRRWRSWEDYMREWLGRESEDPEFAAYIQKLAEDKPARWR
jgi:hypothetical protein